MVEALLAQAKEKIGTPPQKVRITLRSYPDPEPVVELAEGESVMHIILVPLEPIVRPDAVTTGQKRYE